MRAMTASNEWFVLFATACLVAGAACGSSALTVETGTGGSGGAGGSAGLGGSSGLGGTSGSGGVTLFDGGSDARDGADGATDARAESDAPNLEAGDGSAGDAGAGGSGGAEGGPPYALASFKATCNQAASTVTNGGQWYGFAKSGSELTSPFATGTCKAPTGGSASLACTPLACTQNGNAYVAEIVGNKTAAGQVNIGFTFGNPPAPPVGSTGITFKYMASVAIQIRLGISGAIYSVAPTQPGVPAGTCGVDYANTAKTFCVNFPYYDLPATTTWQTVTVKWDAFTVPDPTKVTRVWDYSAAIAASTLQFIQFGVVNMGATGTAVSNIDIAIDTVALTTN
jgi:hypothetical protein